MLQRRPSLKLDVIVLTFAVLFPSIPLHAQQPPGTCGSPTAWYLCTGRDGARGGRGPQQKWVQGSVEQSAAAEAGNAIAQYQLGVWHADQRVISANPLVWSQPDWDESGRWLIKAAASGFAPAQTRLAFEVGAGHIKATKAQLASIQMGLDEEAANTLNQSAPGTSLPPSLPTRRSEERLVETPPALARALKDVDDMIFPSLTRLVGFEEEVHLYQIRELMFRYYLYDDGNALRRAVIERDNLKSRVRSRVTNDWRLRGYESETKMTMKLIDSNLSPMDSIMTRWASRMIPDSVAEDDPLTVHEAPDGDLRLLEALAIYRGPDHDRFLGCGATPLLRNRLTFYGLPDVPLTVRFNGSVMQFDLVADSPGHRSLVFKSEKPGMLCAEGSWAITNSKADIEASAHEVLHGFEDARSALRRIGEEKRLDPIEEAWTRYERARDFTALQEAVSLRAGLLRYLPPFRTATRSEGTAVVAVEIGLAFIDRVAASEPRVEIPRFNYNGPREGEIRWLRAGRTDSAVDVEILTNKANIGDLVGSLPGVAVTIEIIEPREKGRASVRTSPDVANNYKQLSFHVGKNVGQVLIRWKLAQ